MYSNCIHCARPLGSNDAIEAMPIGHRLAFDEKRGQLWIICRDCERWNLTPFDERWEAIEQCERLFRGTSVRVSSDNIGLARLHDGTELVRVGMPLRPEFAAWRYGDQFGRRRKKVSITAATLGAGVIAGAGLVAGGLVTAGVGIMALVPMAQLIMDASINSDGAFLGRWTRLPSGELVHRVSNPKLITTDAEEGWGIAFEMNSRITPPKTQQSKAWFEGSQIPPEFEIVRKEVRGSDATRLLREFLPSVNRRSSRREDIAHGVQLIEDAGGPNDFARWAAERRHQWAAQQTYGDSGDMAHIPAAARLAFEMALHEDSERRAMNGELAELERAWQDAAHVASIADSLLTPPEVQERLDALKREPPPKI